MPFETDKNVRSKDVNSGMINAIQHFGKEQKCLVFFKNGDVWEYSPVSVAEYGEFSNAPSIGKYFHSNIKNKNSKKIK